MTRDVKVCRENILSLLQEIQKYEEMANMPRWNSNKLLQHLKATLIIIFILVGLCLLVLLLLNRDFGELERTFTYYVGNIICLCAGIVLHECGHILASAFFRAKVKKINVVKGILPQITIVLDLPDGLVKIDNIFILAGGIFFPIYLCYIVVFFLQFMAVYMDLFLVITVINAVPILDTDGNKIKKIILRRDR